MRKTAATATVNTVRKAIIKDSGTFAGYAVDVNSITAAEKEISKYYGQFRVPDLKFNPKWGDISTPEYDNLASDVKMKLDHTYNIVTGSSLVYVTDILFRKGSVIVDFYLGVDDVTNKDKLKSIFSGSPFLLGNNRVDSNSFVFSEYPLGVTDVEWFPAVLGSVLSLVLLVLVIILVVFIVLTCRRNRRRTSPENEGGHQLHTILSKEEANDYMAGATRTTASRTSVCPAVRTTENDRHQQSGTDHGLYSLELGT
ncbi:hypothetical protein NP493_1501g00013 [Ridgeia piscesae]|uniref:SEA domain-containing protein n=1 Tax=Ridgeia piscesae TaxID=27915 RepID=A0AAD9ND55_RIDPI|nr:hypothetical protein NP493_1501g00013 [Ridgeia piscesae]